MRKIDNILFDTTIQRGVAQTPNGTQIGRADSKYIKLLMSVKGFRFKFLFKISKI